MPAKPLPDLGGVDPAELQLEILAILEEHLGQKTRTLMRNNRMQFGDLLDYAGGARLVLRQSADTAPRLGISAVAGSRSHLRHHRDR